MTQIKLRRDTSANFTSANPVLGVGEPAYETDTKKLKIGDGTTAYTQLEYFSTDLDKLNASKMYRTGEISTDTMGYNQLVQMKHSTFDLSKFTVVGSPTITEDGIASGISASNYLTFPLNINPQNILKIQIEGVHGDTQTSAGTLFYISDGTTSLTLYRNRASKMSGEVGSTSKTYISDTAVTTNGARYKYVVSFDIVTNKYSYQYYENDVLITQKDNMLISVLADMNWSNITIGNIGKEYSPLKGSIDLKQFSITVDGKEVFSGNKTGLDVIKPDNYEVVGSPTITEDGVASGFLQESQTYIKCLDSFNGKDNWEILLKVNTGVISSVQENHWILSGLSDTTRNIVFGINAVGKLIVYLSDNGRDFFARAITGHFADYKKNNTDFWFNISFDGKKYTFKRSLNGINYETDFVINNATKIFTAGLKLGNNETNGNSFQGGSIDLNAFKIYVDGNLVYQPCLKIPYTQSKTGSKIVDVAYRDRVIDLYEQEGQAGYYTIDEENKNFTLPMGEIYGMIGQRSLISSTVTETNRVDIYSDKTCLICGNVATAGTINLPIELANNNYFITLSTSAKTATSFTTTATGDYILIGEVV